MLKTILLRNWKSFLDEEIPLKALTLLSGPNGAGKSSVLQALLALRQSFQQRVLSEQGLSLQGELVQLGTAEDVMNDYATADEIELALETSEGWLSWLFSYNTSQAVQESRHLKLAAFSPLADWDQLPLFAENAFQSLHAERIGPRVSYAYSDTLVESQKTLGSRGEYTAHFLSRYGEEKVTEAALLHPSEEATELRRQVEAWMTEICPGTKIHPKPQPSLDQIQLLYSFEVPGVPDHRTYRATHVGFGITYTLPVLVALLSSKPGSLLLIENPEAHLHPKGQRQLGLLIAKAASCGRQILIESHSDHILNGIRLAVAKGVLASEDVALHFFERLSEDAKSYTFVESPQIDPSGRIEPWPSGFFDEITAGLSELLQAEAKRRVRR